MNENLLHWSDANADAASDGVVRRRIVGRDGTLVRITIPAGLAASPHRHPHEQFVQIVRGSGTLTTKAGTRRFAAGDVFHFPADTEHAATFEEDSELLEINITPA